MTDQTIDEIRRARKIISDEIGAGLDGLVSRYASFESRFRRPALTPKDRRTIRYKGAAKSGGVEVDDLSSPPRDR